MSLQTIRGILPHPTPNQKTLIGAHCLALTEDEKRIISVMSGSVENILRFYLQEAVGREALAVRRYVRLELINMQETAERGRNIGGTAGAVIVSKTLCAVGCRGIFPMLAGGVVGGITGAMMGEALALISAENENSKIVVENTRRATEARSEEEAEDRRNFIEWGKKQFNEIIFPALSEFANHELDEFRCPLTGDWIREPVFAEQTSDRQIYEKAAILEHLRRFEEDHPLVERAQMDEGACRELARQTSPRRICHIQVTDLVPELYYRAHLFQRMRDVYNHRVTVQRQMTAPGVTPLQAARMAQRHHIGLGEMIDIGTFYILHTNAQRTAIATEIMARVVTREDVPIEQRCKLITKIQATAMLPDLLPDTFPIPALHPRVFA